MAKGGRKDQAAGLIRSRIVGHGDVKPEDLLANPLNFRRHPGNQMDALRGSLKELGWLKTILINKTTGHVLDGHARVEEAMRQHQPTVPVTIVELTEDEERLALAVLDPITEMATRDQAILDELLAEVATNDAGLQALIDELAGKDQEAPASGLKDGVDPDAVPDPPKVPVTKPGDIITLGRHRLMCGDCREFSHVSALMAGAKINVAVTSPPYASQRKYDETSGFKPIPPDEYVEWYRDVAANIMANLAEDGSYFCNIKEHCEDGQRSLYVKDLTLAHVRVWGWQLVDEFCWRNTRNGVPGGWPNRFKNAWEPVFHFSVSEKIKFRPESVSKESDGVFDYSKENSKATSGSGLLGHDGRNKREGMARPSNVVEVGAEVGQGDHAAPFPVALPEFFIKAFSDEGDIVFDPFMGSGTTLIAAEKNGRIAYGTEISPIYCDVIVRRWEEATGQKAVRMLTGGEKAEPHKAGEQ